MKTKLICPALRPAVAGLARRTPLATLPLLGCSPLGAQLSTLYANGYREVEVLVADRSELVRAHVGSGEAWGLRVTVTPVASEQSGVDASVLDDENSECKGAFESYRNWFEMLRTKFSTASTQRAGMRELSPGVCVHARAEISPTATLSAPCWIGANTRIGPECLIGPDAYIEDNSFIEQGANIESSWVGPSTYVGPFIDILDSLAWGRWLCKWTTGATTQIHDAFLLSDIPAPTPNPRGRWWIRALAMATVLGTLFVPLLGALLSKVRRRPFYRTHTAVLPNSTLTEYGELAGFDGILRRWPRLLSIIKGNFAWVGNPPLSPAEAGALISQYERLWYAVRPGLVSLADVHGTPHSRDEEAIAHATYFVASQSVRSKLGILFRAIWRNFRHPAGHGKCDSNTGNEDILRRFHHTRQRSE